MENNTSVPRLRFPQFRGSAGWEEKLLGEIAKPITKKNKGSKIERVLTNSAVGGVMDQRDYFEKDIANKDNLEGYCIVDFGDYVYNPRISVFAPVGPISKNKIGIGAMSPLYTVFRFTDSANDFYEQYFNASHWHNYMFTIANTGARHDRIAISSKAFMEMPVPFPTLPEQQKIADCLSSLDDLIAAESAKLQALGVHKKGLLQGLFPAGGETVPRLRFSEFAGSGDWEEKMLGEVCNVLNNRRKPVTSSDRVKGVYPYYGASGIVDYVDEFIFDERLVLVGEDGAKWGAFEKSAFIAEGKYWVNNHAHVLRPILTIDTFLENYLVMLDITQFITGAAPPKLTLGKLKEIKVPVPPTLPEQQKIADCLSSLDALLAAQQLRIAALQRHKQGLMQQLFPAAL